MSKVTVIGGGTGSYTVLSGLKKYSQLELKAIINATDSGGSTGRLRDEYGILPVGDIRQCMVALAGNGNGNSLLRQLLMYRFPKGELKGHNFGNLFIAALSDILGSDTEALKELSKILNIKGEIVPITEEDIDLVAEYDNGEVLVGEANIDEPNSKHDNSSRITDLRIQPHAKISKRAYEIIRDSEYIILGPGDLYTSILSNIVVDGAGEAIRKSGAKLIFIINLMSKHGLTNKLTAQGYIDELNKYLSRIPDFIIVNNSPFPDTILKEYSKENAFPVKDDIDPTLKSEIIRKDIASHKILERKKEDKVKRSLIRHDSDKLARIILDIILKSK
jgi:uncharacterized cofD-like protein